MVGATRDVLLLLLILVYKCDCVYSLPTSHGSKCVMGMNCHLPNCLCRSRDTPGDLNKTDIPQIVLFTFEGPLDDRAYKLYQELFPITRRNPNGCPGRITLFLQGNNTNYSLAADMYERRVAELAVSSLSSQPKEYWRNITYDKLLAEVSEQKRMIHEKAKVPLEDIKGYRSPYLQPSRATYQMLSTMSMGFEYDSSMSIRKKWLGEQVVWPFTLDYGWGGECVVAPCPVSSLSGIWEFPVYTLIDLDGIARVDHSAFQPRRSGAAFRYLVQNFRTFYRKNRTPFILNLRPEWLYSNETLSATKRFLDRLMNLPDKDVYLLSLSDALEWVKSPRDTPDSTNFTAWKCSRSDIDPAPVAPPPPGTVNPSNEPWCLSINGVLKCEQRNPTTSPATTTTTASVNGTSPTSPGQQPTVQNTSLSISSTSSSPENTTVCSTTFPDLDPGIDYLNSLSLRIPHFSMFTFTLIFMLQIFLQFR